MLDEINLMLTASLDHFGYPICSLELSRMLQLPNGLKLVMVFDNRSAAHRCCGKRRNAQASNGGFEPRFQALVQAYDFDWMGYLIGSSEIIKRQFRGDWDKWKLVTPPRGSFLIGGLLR